MTPGQPIWREVSLRGQRRQLELPTAGAVLRARAEASLLESEHGQQAVIRNACLLAQTLTDGRSPLYSSGRKVLEDLTPVEIEALSEEYRLLLEVTPPSPASPAKKAEDYKDSLKKDPEGRLRWKVMRAFHALPTEDRVRRMTPEDYLYCALNLILDREEVREGLCPRCREEQESRCPCCGSPLAEWSGGENPGFDGSRFAALGREVAK